MLRSFQIADDSGFLAIVNAEKYTSFVSEEWEYGQLVSHFISEMNKDTLIIWRTGCEGYWNVRILDNFSDKPSFKEFTKTLEVTNGQLFLTNYKELTMAAQFIDCRISIENHPGLCINLKNGNYSFTIRQMFNPEEYSNTGNDEINFEIIVKATINYRPQKIENIFL